MRVLIAIVACIVSTTAIPIDNELILKRVSIPGGPGRQVCNTLADILFIIDGSTSIGEDNFVIVKQFLRGTVNLISSEAPGTRYAAIQFSGLVRSEFSFNTYKDDYQKIEEYFTKMAYLRGTTKTGKALDFAQEKELIPEAGNRPDVEDIVIVITDGRSSDEVKQHADEIRALGAQVFAIGVTNAIDFDELVEIAGKPESVILVDDFTKLDDTARQTLLSKRECKFVTDAPRLSDDAQLDIECLPTGMKLGAETKNPFEGVVYVKNHNGEESCRIAADGTQKYAGIEVSYDECGTERRRSLNPPGLFVEQNVVFQFHQKFVTKVDRAFKVRCFYMEADKTVEQNIAASAVATSFISLQFPMPTCSYSIRSESDTGPEVRFAVVGMKVFHVWECDNAQSQDLFKMRVHSCFVDDGNNERVELLDANGCMVDKFLLQNLQYDGSGMRAFQEAHVFKFADRPQLYFQCQVELCVDAEGGCVNTPPTCDGSTLVTLAPTANRTKRNVEGVVLNPWNHFDADVATDFVEVVMADDLGYGNVTDVDQLLSRQQVLIAKSSSLCINGQTLTILCVAGLTCALVSLSFVIIILCNRRRHVKQ